ncbi:unnamed protein product [Phytophthora fragariaefolia]|uniref:Unnamed protein product n=1 Tax=Phytophthora fragariaefolia TaxID=1490495 RepID=A0A9W7D4Z0_9STRA|nr:unnamed protein product [Phytophthora fragariaefolia]
MSDKKTYGKWYIASLELSHSHTCDSERRLTTRQIAGLPAFMEAVHANPKASIESLVLTVLERHGVTLEKQMRLVYRARDMVRSGKAVVRNTILASHDAPLPPRQFVHRRIKAPPECKVPKNADRMAWTQALVESLLVERIVKHGREFVEAGELSQHRELWEVIHRDFNAMHQMSVTVTQLRAKYRYLQEQYVKTRAEEEEAEKNAEKLVVYPRCWDMLAEYFGDEVLQSSPSFSEVKEGILTDTSNGQEVSAPTAVETSVPAQSAPASFVQAVPLQPAAFQAAPVQTTFQSAPLQPVPTQSAAVYSASTPPVVPQTQASVIAQDSSPDVAPKRRRVNPSVAHAGQQEPQFVVSNLTPVSNDVVEKLETIQTTQNEISKCMDGIKQIVEQSNQAIGSLQQALNQANQVNAALLDFLRQQPPPA